MKCRTDANGLYLYGGSEEIRKKADILLSKRYRSSVEEREEGLFIPFLYESCPKRSEELEILYRDPFYAVVRKPKGLLVHNDGNDTENLQDKLSARLGIRVQALHRLDTDTDGPVLFSLSPVFQAAGDRMIAERKVRREYLAFVEGEIKEKEFTVDQPIGKDRHRNNVYRIAKNGRAAKTFFTLLGSDGKRSLLRCRLSTGRRHQIRVHLASLGHPLVGDTLYGKGCSLPLGLSAVKLSFLHPVFEKEITADCAFDERYRPLFQKIMRKS